MLALDIVIHDMTLYNFVFDNKDIIPIKKRIKSYSVSRNCLMNNEEVHWPGKVIQVQYKQTKAEHTILFGEP